MEDNAGEQPETHVHDPDTERRQIESLNQVRSDRDNERISGLLEQLKEVARDDSRNIMPITIELVEARASVGEIVKCLKDIWGTYREVPVF